MSYDSIRDPVGVNTAVLEPCVMVSTTHALFVIVVMFVLYVVPAVPGARLLDTAASGACCFTPYNDNAPTPTPLIALLLNVTVNVFDPVGGSNKYQSSATLSDVFCPAVIEPIFVRF